MRKFLLTILVSVFFVAIVDGQSGRRKTPTPSASPTPGAQPSPTPNEFLESRKQITAEKDQDYRCSDDGSLDHLIDDSVKKGFEPKEVDTRAEVLARPEAKYTEEARRMGVQGRVILKLLLTADQKIERIRVVRTLPFGLTENAIRAACVVKFKPALKAGQPVDQWVTLEYGFALAKSSIFGP
jgi:TonB family protein